MTTIGILTFHRSINYGAYMQSYALSHEIKRRFPSSFVEIIDFEYLFKHNNYKKIGIIFPFCMENKIKYNAFQKDLNKLPLSSKTFITDYPNENLINYINDRYNILIVGSDAVWAFKKMKLENPYWLFGNKIRNDIIKMSFAASAYSTDFRSVSDKEKSYIGEHLNNFTYIGVRDQETRNFIGSILPHKKIYLNNDPTFFLEKSVNLFEAQKVLKKNLVYTKKPLISFMTRSLPYIEEIKKHLGNQYKFVHFNHRDKFKDILDKNTRFIFNLSPLEWYNIYSLCFLNFSQYFHGTLLGIRNAIPTFSIDDTNFNYPYIGKNEQVMTDLGLRDYLFHTKFLKTMQSEKERLITQIGYVIKNYEKERIRIENAANIEKNKGESFFEVLKKYIS
jgi:hypothetical protein